jgi:hypothetical protein
MPRKKSEPLQPINLESDDVPNISNLIEHTPQPMEGNGQAPTLTEIMEVTSNRTGSEHINMVIL